MCSTHAVNGGFPYRGKGALWGANRDLSPSRHQLPGNSSAVVRLFALPLLVLPLLVLPLVAIAAPATINVTPTALSEDGTGGTPDGFRLYRGCDLALQTVGAVIADPAVVATQYSFAGDTGQTYDICARAFNALGEGGFSEVVRIGVPPGDASGTYNCTFDVTSPPQTLTCTQVVNP